MITTEKRQIRGKEEFHKAATQLRDRANEILSVLDANYDDGITMLESMDISKKLEEAKKCVVLMQMIDAGFDVDAAKFYVSSKQTI